MTHPERPETAIGSDYLIRKGAFWYRPNSCGYTDSIYEAGRYTKAEADRAVAVEPWHMKAVPLTEAMATYATPTDKKIAALADRVAAAESRVQELERLVYVPGLWRCAKCDFELLQSNLNAADRTVTARDTPGDKCPNCESPLWRVTERQRHHAMWEDAVRFMDEARSAERDRDQLREAIQPFAAVADEYHESESDNFEVWVDAGPEKVIRSSFELGKFRKARAALPADKQAARAGSVRTPHTRQFWQRQHDATWGKPKDLGNG